MVIKRWLSKDGIPLDKKVYLTESTKIYEPKPGKEIREKGRITLENWLNYIETKSKDPSNESYYSGRYSGYHGGSLRTSSLW